MARLFALFPDLTATVQAIDALKALHLDSSRIEALSSVPIPPEALGLTPTETFNQPRAAVGMGMVGAAFGFLLAGGTAMMYPLPTGGKPIVAMPTIGIVMYETTMLAAIWTTFFYALVLFRGRRFRGVPTDPRIQTGAIALLVEIPPERRREDLDPALAGALEVKPCD